VTFGEDKGDREKDTKQNKKKHNMQLSIPLPPVCSSKTSKGKDKRKDSQVYDCNKLKGKKDKEGKESGVVWQTPLTLPLYLFFFTYNYSNNYLPNRHSLFHTLGAVAGERRLENSLRGRMVLTAKRVTYSGRASDN
jgi:hypothetical protein